MLWFLGLGMTYTCVYHGLKYTREHHHDLMSALLNQAMLSDPSQDECSKQEINDMYHFGTCAILLSTWSMYLVLHTLILVFLYRAIDVVDFYRLYMLVLICERDPFNYAKIFLVMCQSHDVDFVFITLFDLVVIVSSGYPLILRNLQKYLQILIHHADLRKFDKELQELMKMSDFRIKIFQGLMLLILMMDFISRTFVPWYILLFYFYGIFECTSFLCEKKSV